MPPVVGYGYFLESPNVWLHSIVGRALYRYHRDHGFESRWSLDFFRLPPSNCLNWKICCDDHSSLLSITAVHIHVWTISCILHIIPLLMGRYELNQLTSLPMCDFIAQLVEYGTGITKITAWKPIQATFTVVFCCSPSTWLKSFVVFLGLRLTYFWQTKF